LSFDLNRTFGYRLGRRVYCRLRVYTCSVIVRAQSRLDSDVIFNVTGDLPSSDVTASVTSSCGDVIDAVRLKQWSDDAVTAVPTQPMSNNSDNDTDATAAADDDDVDEDLDSPTEQRLMRHLLRRYETAVRPVRNASETVIVRMGLTLTQIFNMVSHFIFSIILFIFTSLPKYCK